ncbi:MAG: hypothetical protein MZW92_22885 [Comamonadaceae bacterium]|nr:hypothetical protein [Comamonadaceae bacterium]
MRRFKVVTDQQPTATCWTCSPSTSRASSCGWGRWARATASTPARPAPRPQTAAATRATASSTTRPARRRRRPPRRRTDRRRAAAGRARRAGRRGGAGTRRRAPTDKAAAAPESSTLRVSVEKVDQLINLVGELVITQAMLAQNSKGVDAALHQQMAAGLADLERNTRDLQEAVMSIRMIPMSLVFNRFPRMLRDLAGKLGKKVELMHVGEATELDKGLVEKITDPLTHLVRNSCDHGIEPPAERVGQGQARAAARSR